MRLTFVSGKFRLNTKTFNGPSDRWLCDDDGYYTTHVPAALKFKRFADSKALKILDRAYVKFYEAGPLKLPKHFIKIFPPDSHQKTGIEWVLSRNRSYLAHAPGGGKTYEAIVASLMRKVSNTEPEQTLFIVPPSLTLNWVRELERFAGAMAPNLWPSISVLPKSPDRETMGWNADFLIIPDSMLAKDWVIKELVSRRKRITFVAVDEASRFKDPHALRTIALFGGMKGDFKSPGLVAWARHAVLMDGSPMPNRPMELWAPTYAMSPETIDFMGERDFGFRYCGAKINDWGEWEFRGSAHEAELKAKLQRLFMHVVLESELKHPERRRKIVVMNEDPRKKEFKEWERGFLKNVNLSRVSEKNYHGLGKELNDPSIAISEKELSERRRQLGEMKIPFIASYVKERAEKGESILLFAWHRSVCVQLKNALKALRPALVIGGTRAEDRETWFQSFQKGDCKLIIGNIAAMGRGHNLQRADRVIFGEYSWTDELNKQCEKRMARRGNTKEFVPCDYIVVPNSMDEMILSSNFTKERRVNRVIG